MKKDRFGSASFRLKAGLRTFRFWRWLIRFIGVIVPRRFRAAGGRSGKRNWNTAKRCWPDGIGSIGVTNSNCCGAASGAFWDALWLQPQRLEDEMFQDLRFGVRMLLKNPGFTVVAALTLALGIGVNTALFTVFNAVALRPLPVKEPERIVKVYRKELGKSAREVGGSSSMLSYPEYAGFRDNTQVFSGLTAYAENVSSDIGGA